eukprot:CAMPEP_0170778346 /NCGR_PEP_ID=MMETSP0733-20121128/12335_1 /TAXON_ID=186038 /ORGANISM="Fragilariopsis kerguelensis, Strain L26-C5" /LENGTH=70 /DNA_ID=CAMNT_0011121749 /DNA_START=62 /DNA_END=274 /DNA_ORIENTATION=-
MVIPPSTSPWIYFLSGSLLPTIAYIIWRKNVPSVEEDYVDDSDSDDDDDDDDGDSNDDVTTILALDDQGE